VVGAESVAAITPADAPGGRRVRSLSGGIINYFLNGGRGERAKTSRRDNQANGVKKHGSYDGRSGVDLAVSKNG